MGNRFQQWKHWKKHNMNGRLYQYLVLIGVIHSVTFEAQREMNMFFEWFEKGLKKAEEQNNA